MSSASRYQRERGGVVVLPVGDPGRAGQALGACRRRRGGAGQREQPIEPRASLAEVPAPLPEPPGRVAQPEAHLGLAGLDRPVTARRGGCRDRGSWRRAPRLELASCGSRASASRQDDLGVPPSRVVQLARLGQPLEGELADGLEHRQAWLPVLLLQPAEEALVGQALESLDRVPVVPAPRQQLVGGRRS